MHVFLWYMDNAHQFRFCAVAIQADDAVVGSLTACQPHVESPCSARGGVACCERLHSCDFTLPRASSPCLDRCISGTLRPNLSCEIGLLSVCRLSLGAGDMWCCSTSHSQRVSHMISPNMSSKHEATIIPFETHWRPV
jgi:hypothetical protein